MVRIINPFLEQESSSTSGPVGIGGEVAWWCPSIDDSAIDLTGNGNDGTYAGGMATTADTDSGGVRAYAGNGSSTHITIPNAASFAFGTSDWSCSYWAKTVDLPSVQYAVDKGVATGAATRLFSGLFISKPTFWNNNVYLTWGSNATADTWHHIAFGRYGTTRWLSLDNGTPVTATISAGLSFTNTDQLVIGARSNGTNYWWNGLLDDIRFFNRQLDSTDLAALSSQRGYQP